MQRSRLKNIINKSKELSKQRDPYDLFVGSLPSELDYFKDGGKYRLKAAWEAYDKPKNYNEALLCGLVDNINGHITMPSIGYNQQDNSYEYLYTGKDNDLVARDIYVWNNETIPLVKELKLGGYIRTFNEDKNCWTYSKNEYKRTDLLATINKFLSGGLTKLNDEEAGENPVGYLDDGTPLYKKGDGSVGPLTKENIGKDNLFDLVKNSDANFAKRLLNPNRKYITYPDGSWGNFKLAWSEDETGTIVYPEILEINGELIDLSGDPEKAWRSAIEHKDYIYFPSNEAAEWFTKNYKKYYKGFDKTPQAFKHGGKKKIKIKTEDEGFIEIDSLDEDQKAGRKSIGKYKGVDLYLKGDGTCGPGYNGKLADFFKQGGQMNVIPEGALHARKNGMELAKDGEVTHKGIPVIDNDGNLQAEIEKNEIIFNYKTTLKIEEYYDEYNDSESQAKKDEIAIECGKMLCKSIIEDTDDKTGLIQLEANKL